MVTKATGGRWAPAVLVAIGSAVWFGVTAAAVDPGPVPVSIGLLAALVGVVGLAGAHERQSGGRWLGGLALVALPGLLLFISPVAADEDGFGLAGILVGFGAVLVVVSMTAAGWVRRRFGDTVDTGGANFYG